MFRKPILVIASLALIQAVACHRDTGAVAGLVIRSVITPKPARVGPAEIAMTVLDSSAKPVTEAKIFVEVNMARPGRAPAFSVAREGDPGQYRSDIEFSMPGDWTIRLHVKLADGTMVERQIGVPAVAAH